MTAYGQINVYNNSSSTGPVALNGSSGGVYPVTGTWVRGITPSSVSYDLVNGFLTTSVSGVFEITCQVTLSASINSHVVNPAFQWALYQNGTELTASSMQTSSNSEEYSPITFGGLFQLNASDKVQPKVEFLTLVNQLVVTDVNFYMAQIA